MHHMVHLCVDRMGRPHLPGAVGGAKDDDMAALSSVSTLHLQGNVTTHKSLLITPLLAPPQNMTCCCRFLFVRCAATPDEEALFSHDGCALLPSRIFGDRASRSHQ